MLATGGSRSGAERCCCGNVLREGLLYSVRILTCRCAAPGPGRLVGGRAARWDAGKISRAQYEERRALGLPLIADCERVGRLR